MQTTFYSFKKKSFFLKEKKLPRLKDGEVLVRIKSSALCGTDIHIMNKELMDKVYDKDNITLGHEWAGVIADIGPKVKNIQKGDRVFGSPHIPCGRCHNCKIGNESLCDHQAVFGMTCPGSHAQYLIAPQTTLFHLPANVNFTTGSLLSDTVSTAYHAVKKVKLTDDSKILIMGAGPVGITIGVLLKILGHRGISVLETSSYRSKVAQKLFGAKIYNKKNSKALKRKINFVFDTTGASEALEAGFHSLVRGGKLIVVGIHKNTYPLDALRLMYREISILGSFGYSRQEAKEFTKLFCENSNHKKLARIISHAFKPEKINEAYNLFQSKKSGKIILQF